MNQIMKKAVFTMVALAGISLSVRSVTACDKQHVGYKEVESLCQSVYEKVNASGFEPDLLIGLSRGGLTPLGLLAGEKMFDIRATSSISLRSYDKTKQGEIKLVLPVHTEDFHKFKSILVIDDLVDSGATIAYVVALLKKDLEDTTIKTAVLFHKPKNAKIMPDYYAQETDNWIVFPWEKE